MNRRAFLEAAGVVPAAALVAPAMGQRAPDPASAGREAWVQLLERVAAPVLTSLAEGQLRRRMPVEQAEGSDRSEVTHLEAVGRLLNGIAPWLEVDGLSGAEAQTQIRFRTLALDGLRVGLDPASTDALNFTRESQPLVDAAFLGQALLRAPARYETASMRRPTRDSWTRSRRQGRSRRASITGCCSRRWWRRR